MSISNDRRYNDAMVMLILINTAVLASTHSGQSAAFTVLQDTVNGILTLLFIADIVIKMQGSGVNLTLSVAIRRYPSLSAIIRYYP